jgi:dephospho-CoA kinase
MLKIAITGNIASGKSAVEEIIIKHGYKVFDTDKIAHKILEESTEVLDEFNGFDITTNGKIDRKKLGAIVFADNEKLKKLENIIHPQVKNEILKIFTEDYPVVFISVPQLFEAGFQGLFDKIIFVTADKNIRRERLMKRNNFSKEDVQRRISAQTDEEQKVEQADYVIINNTSREDLEELTIKILDKISNLI